MNGSAPSGVKKPRPVARGAEDEGVWSLERKSEPWMPPVGDSSRNRLGRSRRWGGIGRWVSTSMFAPVDRGIEYERDDEKVKGDRVDAPSAQRPVHASHRRGSSWRARVKLAMASEVREALAARIAE